MSYYEDLKNPESKIKNIILIKFRNNYNFKISF